MVRTNRNLLLIGVLLGVVLGRSGWSQETHEWSQVLGRLEAVESELALLKSESSESGSVEYIPPFPLSEPAPPAPEFPTIKVGGFFQADSGWFYQDDNNIASVGDVQDGADFRRARINVRGNVFENVAYMMEFDFGFPGRPSFMDVYFDIQETWLGTIRVGQWRQPFGMDGLTSVKEMTFLERGLPFAFLPFRQIGIGFFNHNEDETVTWALSGFRFPTDPFGGNVGDSGGYGLASRITTILWHNPEETRLLHLGAGYTMGKPANNLVRYRNQPEFFISETGGSDIAPAGVPTNVPVFVDTGAIDTNTFQQASLELAALVGSLHLQSEAIVAAVKQSNGDTATFSGAYAQAGYVLTGEVRPYVRNNGVFGRIKPKCSFGTQGMGAWEIACRWSYLDLNDSNIAGGYLHNATVGLNWYLNPNTKVQFNYIHSFLDDPLLDKSEADIFALRGQIDF